MNLIVIYPSRSTEQTETYPYRALLNSDQVHRIYLNELGEIENLSLGVASMVLTIVKESEAPEKARMLLDRVNQEITTLPLRQGIIEMIGTIMIYKFNKLSRKEIDVMLGTKFQDIRAFREVREEREQEIALNMLRKNVSVELVAEYTGLTIAQVQQLQGQLE